MEIEIYLFDDYRILLKELFDLYKLKIDHWSHRKFAELAGVRNAGILLAIIKAEKNISPKLVQACIKIFEMNDKEARFFKLLVEYDHCRDSMLKEEIWKKIQSLRVRKKFSQVQPAQIQYYSDPLYSLIISTIEVFGFSGNFLALHKQLGGRFPISRIKNCIKDLIDWEMLVKQDKGPYILKDRFIQPPTTMRESVRKMNKEWIRSAAEAIDRFSPDERHISTAILAISLENREKIMNILEQCRNEIFELVNQDDKAEIVMQYSIQFFPHTETLKRGTNE
jgi:uncharacterized protein (TIGR02147 family)